MYDDMYVALLSDTCTVVLVHRQDFYIKSHADFVFIKNKKMPVREAVG